VHRGELLFCDLWTVIYELEDVMDKNYQYETSTSQKKWTELEVNMLVKAVELYGEKNWKAAESYVGTKSNTQCRQRWLKCTRPGIKKGKWTSAEDNLLVAAMKCGNQRWKQIADKMDDETVSLDDPFTVQPRRF